MTPLFEAIVNEVPAPKGELDGPPRKSSFPTSTMTITSAASASAASSAAASPPGRTSCSAAGTGPPAMKVSRLYQFEGLRRVEVPSAALGDIVAVSGITDLNIRETACSPECVEPLPFVKIDEPTVSMFFMVNNSPFAGREGKYVTSRNIRDRLFKEVETNVAMRVEETDSADTFKVSGRGELHLSILIETMRRQNYEFQVSRPQVIYKTIDGKQCEPIELLMIEVPDAYVGAVMEKLGSRKAELQKYGHPRNGHHPSRIQNSARGLMGYRPNF